VQKPVTSQSPAQLSCDAVFELPMSKCWDRNNHLRDDAFQSWLFLLHGYKQELQNISTAQQLVTLSKGTSECAGHYLAWLNTCALPLKYVVPSVAAGKVQLNRLDR
jgi:hypothetical protein